jgi:hypothetical protein
VSRIAHVSAAGSGSSGLTDAELRATPVPVDTELPAAAALSDTDANPTAPAVGAFNMIWDPSPDAGTPGWRRWGTIGVGEAASTDRVPGIAIFGRPDVSFGESMVSAGVVSPLVDNDEAFHGLRVVSSELLRAGSSPVQQRQSDSEVDANALGNSGLVTPALYNGTTLDRWRSAAGDNMTTGVPAVGTMVFDGTNWDRARGDTTNGLDVDVTRVSGTVTTSETWATGTLANGAETAVSNSAVSVLASNANRKKLILQNTGSNNVRIGVSGVTATTGFRLAAGAVVVFDMPHCPTSQIFSIRETADSTVLAQEVT